MVWVVEGTLNSQPTPANATESFPTPSKHYLRPNRLYRVGRAGGVRAPPKPGQPGPGPATRPRPYDFRIAHLAVPKEGLVSFDTGGADHWDPAAEDDGEPYPLDVVLGNKKLSLSRADGHHVDLDPEQRCQVRDGDTLREKNKGFWFTCVSLDSLPPRSDIPANDTDSCPRTQLHLGPRQPVLCRRVG